MKKLDFVIFGQPVPAFRKAGYGQTELEYLDYKDSLVQHLRQSFPDDLLELPPKALKREWKDLLDTYKNLNYRVLAEIYEADTLGDCGSYYQLVTSALQDAHLILDKQKIKHCEIRIDNDPDTPRMELTLEKRFVY